MDRNIFLLLIIIAVYSASVLGKKGPDYEDYPQDEIVELTAKQLKKAIKHNCLPNGARCNGGALQITPPQRCCGMCSFKSGKCRSYKPPPFPVYPVIHVHPGHPPLY